MLEFSGMNLTGADKPKLGRPWRHDLADLQVGEYLIDKGCKNSTNSKLRLSSVKYARRSGKKFSARTENKGVRVTRIA